MAAIRSNSGNGIAPSLAPSLSGPQSVPIPSSTSSHSSQHAAGPPVVNRKKRIALQDRDLAMLSLPCQDQPHYYDSPPSSPPLDRDQRLDAAYPTSLTRSLPVAISKPSSSSSISNRGTKLHPHSAFVHPSKLGHHSPESFPHSSSSLSLVESSQKRRKLNNLSSTSLSSGFLVSPNLLLHPRTSSSKELSSLLSGSDSPSTPYPSYLPPPPQSPLDLILLPHIQYTFSSSSNSTRNQTFHLLAESTTSLIEQEGELVGSLKKVCAGLRGEGFEWRWKGDDRKEIERAERKETREKERAEERKRLREEERARRIKLREERQEEERMRAEREREEELERERRKEPEEDTEMNELAPPTLETTTTTMPTPSSLPSLPLPAVPSLPTTTTTTMENENPSATEQSTASTSSTSTTEQPGPRPDSTISTASDAAQSESGGGGAINPEHAEPEASKPEESKDTIQPSSVDTVASISTEQVVEQEGGAGGGEPEEGEIVPESMEGIERPQPPSRTLQEQVPSPDEKSPSVQLPTAFAAQDETRAQPEPSTSTEIATETVQPVETPSQAQTETESNVAPSDQQPDPSAVVDPSAEPEPEAEVEVEEPTSAEEPLIRRSGRQTRATVGLRASQLLFDEGGGGGGGTPLALVSGSGLGSTLRGVSFSPDPYSLGGTRPGPGGEEAESTENTPTNNRQTPATTAQTTNAYAAEDALDEEEDPEEEEEDPYVPSEDIPLFASRLIDPEKYVKSLFVTPGTVQLEKNSLQSGAGGGGMETLSSNEQEALVHDCLTDLHRFLSDTLEYRARLSEIRDGILEVERRRKGMWKVVRTVALDWLEEEAAGGTITGGAEGGQGQGGTSVAGAGVPGYEYE
ncbi:uncharacterized protein JCM6883_002295 [Sporobolomyces salmoneus]|uniref:uncharacterized protein n=1 Tax=Sporobolomyces salmoneus TaxID=183962 RepID=UPI003181A55D